MKQIDIIKSLLTGWNDLEQTGIVRFDKIGDAKVMFGIAEEPNIKCNVDYIYIYGDKFYTLNHKYEIPSLILTDRNGATIYLYEVEDNTSKIKDIVKEHMNWCSSSISTSNEGRRAMARESYEYCSRLLDLIDGKED